MMHIKIWSCRKVSELLIYLYSFPDSLVTTVSKIPTLFSISHCYLCSWLIFYLPIHLAENFSVSSWIIVCFRNEWIKPPFTRTGLEISGTSFCELSIGFMQVLGSKDHRMISEQSWIYNFLVCLHKVNFSCSTQIEPWKGTQKKAKQKSNKKKLQSYQIYP